MSRVPEMFGSLVFDDRVMRATLSSKVYASLKKTIAIFLVPNERAFQNRVLADTQLGKIFGFVTKVVRVQFVEQCK